MTILSILNELAADNSRLAKEAILRREQDNVLLQRVIKMAIDPTVNYYIKKIPDHAPRMDAGLFELSWALDQLMALSSRTVTGHAAIDHLSMILENVGQDSADVVKKIILRDLRCGVNESTANKIWKKLIPEFPYQRCELPKSVKLAQWPWAGVGVISQLKADGSFVNVMVEDDVGLMTRNGTVYPGSCLTSMREDVLRMVPPNHVLHSELVIYRDGELLPREISNGKLNSMAKGGTDALEAGEIVRLMVWDILPLADFLAGKCDTPYESRLALLRSVIKYTVNIDIIETRVVKNMDEAFAHYNELIEAGFEGTIIKRMDGIWKDGTSKEQVKLKIDCDVEVRMRDLNAGKGKNAETFGSVRCESECGLFEVNVSGFKDAARLDLFNNWQEYKDGIITIRINNIMKPSRNNPKFSAFLPRFIEHRADKQIADTLERIQLQFDSIVKGK